MGPEISDFNMGLILLTVIQLSSRQCIYYLFQYYGEWVQKCAKHVNVPRLYGTFINIKNNELSKKLTIVLNKIFKGALCKNIHKYFFSQKK